MAREHGGHFSKARGSIHEGGQGSGRIADQLKGIGSKVAAKASQHWPEVANQAQHHLPDLMSRVITTETDETPTKERSLDEIIND